MPDIHGPSKTDKSLSNLARTLIKSSPMGKAKSKKVIRSKDVPATKAMLYQVRDQLIKRMDSKFKAMEARFSTHDSKIDNLASEVHRIALLVEEQNAKNNYVLDHLNMLYLRQDRAENRIDALEETMAQFKKA